MTTSLSQDEVRPLLERELGEPVRDVRPVEGGHVARVFSFLAGDQQYIARFNQNLGANFEKEAFISRLLASSPVPIPRVVRIGRLDTLHYAISQMAPGSPLDRLPPAEVSALQPALLQTLDAIHAADVSATTGYGSFGDDGAGPFPSWRYYLAAIRDENAQDPFYGAWHQLFETSFLERSVFDLVYERMEYLLKYCPEERYLVHGDFSFDNVLAQDGEISAVLDWLNAKYGDFVFDIAWLDFWAPGFDVAATAYRRYSDRNVTVPRFVERIRCYQDYLGLDALRFFAKAGDERGYRWIRDRLFAVAA